MKIEFINNTESGNEPGILNISETTLPEAPWDLAIQRASDHFYLTDSGRWVGEIFYNQLPGKEKEPGHLELLMNAALVDALDTRESYRVTLKGNSGEPQVGRLNILSLTHSQKGPLDNISINKNQTQTAVPEPPKPQSELLESPLSFPEPEDKIIPPKPEEIASDNSAPHPPGSALPAQKKSVWLRIGLLIILALACGIWYFFDQREKNTPEAPLPVSQSENSPSASSQAKEPENQLSAQDQVKKFFNGNDKTAQKALDLYNSLPKNSPLEQDAAYRLIYFAANAGNEKALELYGKCLDPATPQWGGIQKDGLLAWRAYEKAGTLGEIPKKEMLQWLKDQSESGNMKAKNWLSAINQEK